MLVTTSTSSAAASLRVAVWRRLRGLGALYLQQSVCLLPDRPQVAGAVEDLRTRVLHEGGSMRVLCVLVEDVAQTAELVAEITAARDAEYADVLEWLPSFHQEIDKERRRDRTTFEEVEENEVDLDRFRAWVRKIGARDYFGAPLAATVDAELARAASVLRAFEQDAVTAAGQDGRTRGRRLRVVPEET